MAERYDVAVVGAGCIGASVAKHVAEAGHSVLLVEQEKAPALHQSGRNSGVIHVGYNQEPGTTKARYCVEGSRRMRAYCAERDVAMVEGGILVVASRDEQRPVLAELHARGRQNGADVHLVDRDGIEEHEPYAVGVEALWAPEGASVDPVGYTEALVADARAAGAVVRFTQHVADIAELPAKVTVNAAGLQADRLAGPVASDLRVVPFRGFYARVRRPVADRVRSHVYAAPDPAFPFLGVHLSRRVDGSVMAGPGAMLAFGREAYRLLAASGRDLASMATWPGFWRMLGRGDVLRLAASEASKTVLLSRIAKEARVLVPGIRGRDLQRARAGNRAQLVARDGSFVDDILVREHGDAIHVLNAVSPGLTCSLPFGEDLAKQAVGRL